MFGSNSAWGQNNQQNQQQPTNAFGQPATTFGGTGFGAQPATQQQPTNSIFGASAAPSQPSTSTGFGIFGNQAQTSTTTPSTGFGGFGAPAATTSTGFGGFGNTATQPTAFGSTPAANTTGGSVFGANTGNTGFGAFGSKPAGSVFGAVAAAPTGGLAPNNGTASPPWSQTSERDEAGGVMTHFQSISRMPAYKDYSFEELRFADYSQGRKTASGFGSGTNVFGASTSTGSVFGSTQPAQPTAFGAAAPATNTNPFGGFGQQQQQQPATTTPAFGAFGQPAQPQQPAATGFGAFGQTNTQTTGTNLFGQPAQQQQQPAATGFGAFGQQNNQPKPAFGGFGTTTAPATTTGFGGFGQPANTTTTTGTNLFGQPQQQQQQQQQQPQQTGFGAFGNNNNQQQQKPAGGIFGTFGQPAQPAQQTPAPAFGTGNSIFGQPAQNQQQPQQQQPAQQGTNLFGQPAQPAQQTNIFGQPAAPANNLFGQPQQQQQQPQQQPAQPAQQSSIFGGGGGIFGNKPAAPATNNLFGGFGQTAQQPNQQQQQQQQAPAFGGAQPTNLFGQTNTNTQPANNLFGAPSGGSNLFGAPKPATNLFGSTLGGQNTNTQNTGSNFFGSNPGLGQTNAQQPNLTASVDQPISSNLPIHQLLASTGPKAIPLDLPKRSSNYFADYPTRSVTPRIGLNYSPSASKLRGFSNTSTGGGFSGSASGSFKGINPFTIPAPIGGGLADSKSLIGPEAFLSGSVGSSTSLSGLGGGAGVGVRPSPKKLVLTKKVTAADVMGRDAHGPEGVRFDPALSVAAREKANANINSHRSPLSNSSGPPPPAAAPAPPSSSSTTKPAPLSSSTGASGSTPLKEGEYYSNPSIAALSKLDHSALSHLENFTVGRVGYGSIKFLQPVDLTTIPSLTSLLSGTIKFSEREAIVYPEDSSKPPLGEGLNVRAEVKLERVWARDKGSKEAVKDEGSVLHKRLIKKLKSYEGTSFVGFEMETGTWTFEVEGF
ncbi:hypothetical protein SISNIDRAFT_429815 [Sistotremastrum niveocremeum HHB9708]|uniref:Peptidase S59 domain-containing protein n=1 Tax=Sistotremastrum niveocremeum HHB9708 TaxID=1314777 RepID=A0A164SWI6_9AGAM|nr:hypothetical protein SISNIDRAFT_429815 [Sistotremastrum niveocremeum HHB9708]